MLLQNPFDPGYFYTDELVNFGFHKVGQNVAIAKDCVINGLENISLSNNIRIDSGTTIIAASGKLYIGSQVHIAGGCYINSAGNVNIEDFAGISFGVLLFSASDNYSGEYLTNPTVPKEFTKINKGPILLRRHAIIGAGTVVLPNITLNEGAAVGALSLVTKSIPSWEIYSGTPAKFLKKRSQGLLEQEALFLK